MTTGMQITFKRKRVKNLTIRVKPEGVFVTIPWGMREAQVQDFIRQKKSWIESRWAKVSTRQRAYTYTDGEKHWLLGRKVTLRVIQGSNSSCRIHGDEVVLTVTPETDRKRMLEQAWGEQLRPILVCLVQKWAAVMQVHPSELTIKNMTSRWGSCNFRNGKLSFALDLAAKPEDLIESVVIHELTHLLEPSHNQRFQQLMASWDKEYRSKRKRLNHFPREFYG